MPLAAGMGEPLHLIKAEVFRPSDAQAADQLLNRLAREFAKAYDSGADKDVLDGFMAVYGWLKEVAIESKEQ